MVPVHENRISPLLDAARRFLVVDMENGQETARTEWVIETQDRVLRARRIVESGAAVLICGAISRVLENLLQARGVRVIPNTCGPVEEILAAYAAKRLTDRAFLMPGCMRRHRRLRGRNCAWMRGRGEEP